MFLNTIKPAPGSKKPKTRLGRGIGSGKGKTSGKGHKGQHARAGGYHKLGFEGGQMPLQRRLPKFGFNSRKALYRAEIRVGDLNKVKGDIINFDTLVESKLIHSNIKQIKIFSAGELKKAVTVQGIPVSKGAKAAIEALGGKVEA